MENFQVKKKYKNKSVHLLFINFPEITHFN